MSIQGTQTSTYSFQKGGGLQVDLGNTIKSNTAVPQNLSLGQSVPRIPELVKPVTGTNEVFSARATQIESDAETYTYQFAAAANCVDSHVLVAKYNYIFDSVTVKFVTASDSGTLNVRVCDDGEAVGSGTSVLDSTISLAGTTNTNVAGVLTTTQANRFIKPGQSIAFDFGGTVTNIVGLTITMTLRRVIPATYNGSNYLE